MKFADSTTLVSNLIAGCDWKMPKDKTKEKKEKKDKSGKGKKKKDKGKDKKKKDKPELEIRSYVPVEMKCPFCKKNMTTKVVYSTQRSTNALVVMNIISG